MPEVIDVAIAGFGPTGVTLALLLAKRGLRVAVFDKYADAYPKPRAVAIDHEAMRVLQQAGVSDTIAASMRTYAPTVYLGADGQPIQEIVPLPPPHPFAWPPAATFDQPLLEADLRAKAGASANIDVYLNHEVIGTTEVRDRVELSVRRDDGMVRTFAARYVVACDGAQSPMRRRAGISMESLNFEEPWLVIDAIVDEDHVGRLPQTNIQYCDPRRPGTFVLCPGRHRRWEFKVLPGENFERTLPNDFLLKLLAPWLPPDKGQIWRAAAYRFRAVVAEQWRRGRILLAGDAAHQMPPFLGQGMCQGIRDAANLEWKLARVLASKSPDSLLDSYQAERRPHVLDVTRTAIALGAIIGELDPSKARARDRKLIDDQGGAIQPKVRQSLIPGISGGLLLDGAPGSGRPFPQPFGQRDGDRVRADEIMGSQPMLVLRSAPDKGVAVELIEHLGKIDGMLVVNDSGANHAKIDGVLYLDDDEQLLSGWFEKNGCVAALVRPDRYVYGTVEEADQAGRLVQSFIGAIERVLRT